MKLFMYSHTHWDREWYLSRNQFQSRLIRTLDGIIALLDADNGFDTFVLDGQTSIVEDYLELRPERSDKIRSLIAAGKLAIGPWFTMPDLFLPGGEALVRNLLRGYQDGRAFGARFPNVGYVPDSFGHIAQMPQILRGVGIDNYVFSRGRPAALDRKPDGKLEFIWEAPDGSRLTALPLPGSYVEGMFLPGPDRPDALRQRIEQAFANRARSYAPDFALLPHGVDHAWLQPDIAAVLGAVPGTRPDLSFRHGGIEEAVNVWKRAVPPNAAVYRGPLRGRLGIAELHGTLSSRMDNKLMNERARMAIENLAEPLHALARRHGRPDEPWLFRKAWRLIFHNHAHDSICGCSQDRVHADVNRRFREVIELGEDAADSALDYLNNPARRDGVPTLIVYGGLNGGHRLVDFMIRLPKRPGPRGCFMDEHSGAHPLQWTRCVPLRVQHTNGSVSYWECRGCVYLPETAPGEVRKLVFHPDRVAPPPRAAVRVRGMTMSNGRVRVRVRADGTLDLSGGGSELRGAHYFAQDGDRGGGYHFEPIPGDRRRDTRGGRAMVTWLERGPLRARVAVDVTLRVPARYDRRRGRRVGSRMIPIRTIFTLEAGADRLDAHTRLDNSAENQRIRLVLPVAGRARGVHSDAAFAVQEHAPDHWPADPDQNFHPMRSFVGARAGRGGVSFIGRGLHEYETVAGESETRLEITLLRSVDFVLLCGTWKTPEAQLKQPLEYGYALVPHAGNWRAARLPEQAAAFCNPPIALAHGDLAFAGEREAHATTGFYETLDGVEIPVDTNRSVWKSHNAERDGWRRVEPEYFVAGAMPARIVPFRLEGRQLIVSAFKIAEDGRGEILRFWSAAAREQKVVVHAHAPGVTWDASAMHGRDPQTSADGAAELHPSVGWNLCSSGAPSPESANQFDNNTEMRPITLSRVNLLEKPMPGAPRARGRLSLIVRPFEIVTVRLEDAAGRAAGRRQRR